MKKYKVTQEFMDGLAAWSHKWINGYLPVNTFTYENRNDVVESWRFEHGSIDEINQRLGALLNWINGEDVFEIGTPKYIVQRKEIKFDGNREHLYLTADNDVRTVLSPENATRFDSFEKASEWANAHFEVVEVDE